VDARQFRAETTNCLKLPQIHAGLQYIVIQMRKVNREKGYCTAIFHGKYIVPWFCRAFFVFFWYSLLLLLLFFLTEGELGIFYSRFVDKIKIVAVCILFLLKLKWPKDKSFWNKDCYYYWYLSWFFSCNPVDKIRLSKTIKKKFPRALNIINVFT